MKFGHVDRRRSERVARRIACDENRIDHFAVFCVNIVNDLLNAENADERLRDLAITSE